MTYFKIFCTSLCLMFCASGPMASTLFGLSANGTTVSGSTTASGSADPFDPDLITLALSAPIDAGSANLGSLVSYEIDLDLTFDLSGAIAPTGFVALTDGFFDDLFGDLIDFELGTDHAALLFDVFDDFFPGMPWGDQVIVRLDFEDAGAPVALADLSVNRSYTTNIELIGTQAAVVAPVPLPASFALLLAAFGLLLVRRRRVPID